MADMLPESVKFYVVHHEPSDSWQLCLRSGMPCMARRPLTTVIEVCGRTERARPSKGFAWPLNVMHVTGGARGVAQGDDVVVEPSVHGQAAEGAGLFEANTICTRPSQEGRTAFHVQREGADGVVPGPRIDHQAAEHGHG